MCLLLLATAAVPLESAGAGNGPDYGTPQAPSATDYVYAAYQGGLARIDTTTNTHVGNVFTDAYTPQVVVSHDGTRAFVADSNLGFFPVIDLTTDTFVGTYTFGWGTSDVAFSPDEETVWTLVPATRYAVPMTPTLAPSPLPNRVASQDTYAVAVSNDGNTLYMTDEASPVVFAVSASSPESPMWAVAIDDGPVITPAIATSRDGRTGYVTQTYDDVVLPIDLASGAIGTPIPAGDGPVDIAMTPDGKKAYVVNAVAGLVTGINLTDGSLDPPIVVGSLPVAIAIAEDGKHAYVANLGGQSVNVIDLKTRSVTTVPIGASVTAIATPHWTFPACTVTGTDAAETLTGTPGDDVICAGRGADKIYGLGGNDDIWGDVGNDRILPGMGDDTVDGGEGSDFVVYADATGPITIDLPNASVNGAGDDTLVDIERAIGSPYNDALFGDSASDHLGGGKGNDTIDGGGGKDRLQGGPGNDLLVADDGVPDDRLHGGRGPLGATDACAGEVGDIRIDCEA